MQIKADDRLTRPAVPQQDKKHGDDSAPKSPEIDRPAPRNPLMERMKKVDPDQAKKYRQRSGQ
jgi:hypothetical protein